MRATDELRTEHAEIEVALRVLAAMAHRLSIGGAVETSRVAKLLEYFRVLAHGIHPAKEDEALLPALDPTQAAPIVARVAAAQIERAQLRALLRRLESFAPLLPSAPEATLGFIATAQQYDRLFRDHLARQEELLLRPCDRLLSPRQQTDVRAHFARLEREIVETGVKARLRGWLEELQRKRGDAQRERDGL